MDDGYDRARKIAPASWLWEDQEVREAIRELLLDLDPGAHDRFADDSLSDLLARFKSQFALSSAWYALEASNGSSRRAATVLCLTTLLQTVRHLVNEEHLRPLLDLNNALCELERGHVADILKPEKHSHRPPLKSQETLLRARILVACEVEYSRQTSAGRQRTRSECDRLICQRALRSGLAPHLRQRDIAHWRRALRSERNRRQGIVGSHIEIVQAVLAQARASGWSVDDEIEFLLHPRRKR